MKTSNNSRQLKSILLIADCQYAIITILSLLLISFFSACNKEAFDFDKYAGKMEDAQWGIPLVHGTLGILDMINDTTHVSLGNDKLIHLAYSSEMSSPALSDLIQIPDIAVTNNYTLNLPGYMPPDDSVFIPYSQVLSLNMEEGVMIDSLRISSCLLHLQFNTDLNRDARIRIKIPSATINGQSFVESVFYQWDLLQSQAISVDIDLGDYVLKLTNTGGDAKGLKVLFEVMVFNNSEPDFSPYALDVQQQMGDVSLVKFTGNLGNLTLPFETASIPLDIFKNQLSGTINFSEPKISLRVENSVGSQMQLDLVSVRSIYKYHPEMNTALSGDFEDVPWMISSPANGDQIQYQSSFFEINKGNSNLQQLLYNLPDRLSFVARAYTNPGGTTSRNFFFDQSGLTMAIDVELPLNGLADQIVLKDYFKFNFDDLENLKSAEFKLNLKNSFPLQAGLQVYFADAEKLIIDSLFSTPLIMSPGDTDPATMKVIQPSQATASSVFEESRLNTIKYETQNIIVQGMLDTPGNDAVKIFADNYLDIHIGVLYSND